MQLSNFLRTILKLDAASCLGMAALTLPAAGALQLPLGIGSSLLQAAAAALVPIGLFMLWLGSRREAPAAYLRPGDQLPEHAVAWSCRAGSRRQPRAAGSGCVTSSVTAAG